MIKKTSKHSHALLENNWQERLLNYDHLYVGFSGGLDSTVLVESLAAHPKIKAKLSAIHVHHGISPNAEQWLLHCEEYCHRLQIAFIYKRVAVASGANLEERAREARYGAFKAFIQSRTALILAHHQNDQSETVLLNLLRGAGIDGLSAMPEERSFGNGVILRPFLNHPRFVLEAYARAHALQWVEDETNQSLDWSRAYLRHQIIPLLQKKWPNANAIIATSASHCQQAKRTLDALAWFDYPQITSEILECSPDVLRDKDRFHNILRIWLKFHLKKSPGAEQIRQIIDTVIFAREDALPCVNLGRYELRRYRHQVYLLPKKTSVLSPQNWTDFPSALQLSDEKKLVAIPDKKGLFIASDHCVAVKFRKGGEQFHWHGQNKCLKKLFQDWSIPPWQRSTVPLLYINNTLVAVIGYAMTDLDLSHPAGERYTIELQSNVHL